MTVHEQREVIKQMYPGSRRWAKRVNNMGDAQVCAIYLRHVGKKEGEK